MVRVSEQKKKNDTAVTRIEQCKEENRSGCDCWTKRPACDETVQFIRNCKHCGAASCCCCRSSGVFHAVDSSCTPSYPQVHTCSSWNASCASNTFLWRCGSMFGFRSSDSVLDVDWCYNDSLTAPLFARLRQLHSFKQRLLSHLEHSPSSMDSAINTATPSRDSCHCC